MNFFVINIMIIILPFVVGSQSQYYVVTQNFTTVYVDNKIMDLTTRVYKFNNTNAANITFLPKVNFPENMRIKGRGFMNNHKIQIFELDKNIKDAIEMESFDIQSFLIHHARPPVVWPIKMGVTYRITGWIPDSSKFPPNLPGGEWKIQVTLAFANKTTVMEVNCYYKLLYKKSNPFL